MDGYTQLKSGTKDKSLCVTGATHCVERRTKFQACQCHAEASLEMQVFPFPWKPPIIGHRDQGSEL